MQTIETIKTPLEMFLRWERETPDAVFLRQPKALQWTELSWAQAGDAARRTAAFLRSKAYPAGSRIALWSANSKDFVIADLAIMMAGHVSVPLYPGQDSASARYILEHSGAEMVFVGGIENPGRADEAIPAGMERVGLLGAACSVTATIEAVLAAHAPIVDLPAQQADSLWTLVYTSGTTGNPKGVMHAHATPGRVVPELASAMRQSVGDCHLFSYLPMSHIAERILIEMVALYMRGTISFSEGLASFTDELRSVQPTFFFSVPRLWIKFKEGIDAKVPPAAQKSLPQAHKEGIKQMLGLAKARMILTGSAPIPKDVQQGFIDLGIWVRDGYGMTENCLHGCGWIQDGAPLVGCVGQPIAPGVQIRLGEDNEIQFRSPALMQGYYKEPEKTAEVLVNGWYRTGDTGRFDAQGNLWLTGRLSEVFKTSKGKFIKPTALEDRLGGNPLLAQLCVFGHGLDQPVALASLSEAGRVMERPALARALTEALDVLNAAVPSHERLQQLLITNAEWTPANGLLTPTLKLKRKALEAQYRPLVERGLQRGLEHGLGRASAAELVVFEPQGAA